MRCMLDDPTDLSRRKLLSAATLSTAGLVGLSAFSGASSQEQLDAPRPAGNAAAGSGFNTSDLIVDTLIAWEVPLVFGLVGDGINSIIEALRKRQDKIRFIAVRHEEAAAF